MHYIVEEGHPKTYEILKQYLKLFDKIIDRQIQRKSSKVFGRVEIHHNPEKAKKKKKKKEAVFTHTNYYEAIPSLPYIHFFPLGR